MSASPLSLAFLCYSSEIYFSLLSLSAFISLSPIPLLSIEVSASLTSSHPWRGCRGCSSHRLPAAGGRLRWHGDSPTLSGHCTGWLCLTCHRERDSKSFSLSYKGQKSLKKNVSLDLECNKYTSSCPLYTEFNLAKLWHTKCENNSCSVYGLNYLF